MLNTFKVKLSYSCKMKQYRKFLLFQTKNPSYNHVRWFHLIFRKEIYHLCRQSLLNSLDSKKSCTNKIRTFHSNSTPDKIPEMPSSRIKFGLIKVLANFIVGASIGGYLFKQFVCLIEDHNLLEKRRKE